MVDEEQLRKVLLESNVVRAIENCLNKDTKSYFLSCFLRDGKIKMGKIVSQDKWNDNVLNPKKFASEEFNSYLDSYVSIDYKIPSGHVFLIKLRQYNPDEFKNNFLISELYRKDGNLRHSSLFDKIPCISDYFQLNLLKSRFTNSALISGILKDKNYMEFFSMEQIQPATNDINQFIIPDILRLIKPEGDLAEIMQEKCYRRNNGILDLRDKLLLLDSDLEKGVIGGFK